MQYFVTGATGFIGKRLVKKLLERKGAVVHFLIRKESADKVADLRSFWGVGPARAVPVFGDLTAKKLGVASEDVKKLKGQIDHFYHLAAVYDLAADEETQVAVNIEGTRNTVDLAKAIDAGHFHHVSSIAAAGLYEGVFREDMFDEAEGLDHPYFQTKHESEKIVRHDCKVPWTVYRPAMVVGDSTTGEMDKIDGPYYFFKLIQRLRQLLPPWMPTVGLEGGRVNIVPVDFVVNALNVISHQKDIGKKCFHLVDPVGYRVGDVLDIFSRAAHAPRMNLFVNAALLGFIPKSVKKSLMALAPVRRVRNAVMKDLGLPEDMLTFVNYPTRFDCRETLAALKGSGVSCPNLKDYAWRLWDYWERHLDPELFIDRTLKGTVAGKVVLITGGSSGIGLAAAHKFAEAGATTIICGRDQDKLDEACAEAKAKGYQFIAYSADIADMADCDRFVQLLIDNHGGVDFLINNAGRSIRRAIESSYDRFHDYERTMQLNYFGCLRVTMGLLPGMVEKRKGHVVNISSIGVLTNAPRFSAYVASKAALDAWTRCASSEFADQGITFTTINMPLVRTPMIAPTKIYNNVPTLAPEEAADMIAQACIFKPVRIATRLGITGQLLHALVPRVAQITMNTSFRMFPDSTAAKGSKDAKPQLSAEAVALQQMMRGIHF
ncbi:NAD(P)-dependent dehydrogenase (short-subunit alcohol dehydrogenase family) [Acidovorax delafieldii]|uniref:NAD(P)-dependent dehydrogenase (Short-subunit alcohol dehydrogenase family) n=1 Tax=Acidovorax delafieldii TaxID=47920 RepID=A0AAJ2C4R4_ACIDE|nr:SDR family oxidoreductase [Acidovorax delafieldii]MDR6765746.1 NAD(P)-dependent dehydrogenase (short-subunit alcohol dehydrogenase family) [Acidovorax delafieldii]MDR6836183.1 NAD(P)-dependent dehydrogenase (short-subunit alcohol dehydrogenase family) [Acidovorax delafieldii]MDR7364846.1 NAD(P)-dependent dehydrogenase (short-subunit alcohol dehydrogenase family) [Acidovorax delafieldii]